MTATSCLAPVSWRPPRAWQERELRLTGRRALRPARVDSFLTISGPDWAHDKTLCIIDKPWR